MNYDDSFNDSDEVFRLYSSKSITETFKAQFEKIVANSCNLSNPLSQVSNEEAYSLSKTKTSEEIPMVVLDEENSITDKYTDVSKCTASEDSIELIEEFAPKSTRRSERLKKKRNKNVSTQEDLSVNLNLRCKKQRTHRKQKSLSKKPKRKKPVDEITLDDSIQSSEIEDELNPEISVKVIWKSVNVKKFPIRKFQKLSHIYEILSKEENVPKDNIILTFNNIRVNPNDTPDSLNLQVYHFLDGGVLNQSINLSQTSNSQALELNSNVISVKFQDVNKKITVVTLNKNDKLKVGMIMCSEQLEIPLQKIKFFFDGELIQPSETPESLGLENGEIIDIKIIN